MRSGVIIGKFLPLHKGHLALIDFGYKQCDSLYIVICYTDNESIPGSIRKQWIQEETAKYPNIIILSFHYNEEELPNTSESSKEVSKLWANELKKLVPDADVIFSSETYGDYLAEYMNIRHVIFDKDRKLNSISGSEIRNKPLKHWDYISESAKPFFLKKIALVGTESTGKTTLSKKLAKHYNTAFVPEMAREIIEKTEECTYDDLLIIAELHARAILRAIPKANKILFVDTEIIITKSYAEFLFNKDLKLDDWIEEANYFDLYLFLEPDCNFVQDGTRLPEIERIRLNEYHKAEFKKAGISLLSITGNWEERFQKAKQIIEEYFFKGG